MRKFLAIIFLTIFTSQLLPLKAIGKFLSSGQNTEEVQHGTDEEAPDGMALKFDDDLAYIHDTFDVIANTKAFENKVSVFIHTTESLPTVQIAAMPSPPPDIC